MAWHLFSVVREKWVINMYLWGMISQEMERNLARRPEDLQKASSVLCVDHLFNIPVYINHSC